MLPLFSVFTLLFSRKEAQPSLKKPRRYFPQHSESNEWIFASRWCISSYVISFHSLPVVWKKILLMVTWLAKNCSISWSLWGFNYTAEVSQKGYFLQNGNVYCVKRDIWTFICNAKNKRIEILMFSHGIYCIQPLGSNTSNNISLYKEIHLQSSV